MSVEEFKEQYLPYRQKLYRVAFRILENSFDAEDAVQEAYVKLWDKRCELGIIENKESFCVVLVKNLCFDFLRKNRKNIQQITDDVNIADNVQLSEEIEAKDEVEHVRSLMNLLPEQQKKILILKHCDGFSNEEIENITGLKDVHVRVLLSRGRKKMKELFAKEWKKI